MPADSAGLEVTPRSPRLARSRTKVRVHVDTRHAVEVNCLRLQPHSLLILLQEETAVGAHNVLEEAALQRALGKRDFAGLVGDEVPRGDVRL
eukprot:1228997-Pyramimonas_sp.AAC.1